MLVAEVRSRRARSMKIDVITAVTTVRNAMPSSITTAPMIRPITLLRDDVAVADGRHRLERPPEPVADVGNSDVVEDAHQRSRGDDRERVTTTITLPARADRRRLLEERVSRRSRSSAALAELAVAVAVVRRRCGRLARDGSPLPRRFLAAPRSGILPPVPLYLTEQEVAELLTPADALEAVEESFRAARARRGRQPAARAAAARRTGSSR